MRIQSSNVALAGAHSYFEKQTREETMQFWVGSRPPAAGTENQRGLGAIALPSPEQLRRDLPTAAPPATTKTSPTKAEADAEDQLDPLVRMMKTLVERLFGMKIKTSIIPKTDSQPTAPPTRGASAAATDGASPPAVQQQGWGLDYQLQETRTESETTAFAAKGVVRTADGQEIKFEVSLAMQPDGQAEESVTWYEFDADLLELSKLHPDVLFTVRREGEDNDDIEDIHFLGGVAQTCRAIITMPPCTLREATK